MTSSVKKENRNYELSDIYSLIRDFISNEPINPNTDIFKDLWLVGDDFHELIEGYAKKFDVDMTSYLWYFHADEEGHNFPGGLFSAPPYERVKRIPVTPELLLEFARTGLWNFPYPEHSIPKRRYDLLINSGFFWLIVVLIVLSLLIWRI
ncbi:MULTISPECIES: DUF1493 family protein [unclassified Imperialibacter]|uniref:DUF1493 family protein n=1 Tax=unclassified Imperialibacter TaxID=2629706 RepID=UPI0012562A2F|nr:MULTISPECIES: DUF1493 family protein [unclassified Imperialibacter]CAD5284775.1 conserved hypothetical protein [Imperialibacter sp. 75]CAD5296584.1 conserved hypothetical protein [Imperialibacter sp. 89]VVT24321.1 conserved hypothetical protein [Imperialibacter sp. EC-SDR9]